MAVLIAWEVRQVVILLGAEYNVPRGRDGGTVYIIGLSDPDQRSPLNTRSTTNRAYP
jgi:hypothetical protein